VNRREAPADPEKIKPRRNIYIPEKKTSRMVDVPVSAYLPVL